jgi:chromosome segregation ATPase
LDGVRAGGGLRVVALTLSDADHDMSTNTGEVGMAYASYLEDIHERLDQQIVGLRTALEDPSVRVAEIKREAQFLLDACERTLRQVDELRELVSDPHFDLAYEITQLDKEKAELQSEIKLLEAERSRLVGHMRTLERDRKSFKRNLKRLESEIALREKEYEALLRENPAAAYEVYSTPAHMREAKPGESSRRDH